MSPKKNWSGIFARVYTTQGSYDGRIVIDSRDTIGPASETNNAGVDILVWGTNDPTRVFVELFKIVDIIELEEVNGALMLKGSEERSRR